MKPLFTLHLGARQSRRIPAEEVVAAVSPRFDSFALQPVEGWFRGVPDPGWSIRIATELVAELVALATHLRRQFVQFGVGISISDRYFRVVLRTDEDALAAGLRQLLPPECAGRIQPVPGPWRMLRENCRDDPGASQRWTDHLRSTAGEQFCWGQSDPGADDIDEVDSGSARYIAEYLRDNSYRAEDLAALVAEHPEFLPVQEALDLMGH